MKKISILFFATLLSAGSLFPQEVAINNDGSLPDNSAMLDVKSSNKGVLVPRLTQYQRGLIKGPATGLIIFQLDSTSGFYFYNGSSWILVGSEALAIDDLIDGKTDESSVFLGLGAGENDHGITNENVAIGVNALNKNNSGHYNTATGYKALYFNTGESNTANGYQSLLNNINGLGNTAGGAEALYQNTEGIFNSAFGCDALHHNKTGNRNVAIGALAGYKSKGSGNIYIGNQAGESESGDNKLIIDNSYNSSPLIYGDFKKGFIQINGTLSTTKGFLPPRLNTAEMNAITSPPNGLMVYNTTVNTVYFYNGSNWRKLNNNDGESCGQVEDKNNQTYQTTIIGSQCWMSENLNVGTMIPGNQNQTNNTKIEKYCYDNNKNSDNCSKYGGLYQWGEMVQYYEGASNTSTWNQSPIGHVQGICPSGWHIPSDDEWCTLTTYVDPTVDCSAKGWSGTDVGKKLKSTSGWTESGNSSGSDSYGFTALPFGYRMETGGFKNLTYYSFFWSSTEITKNTNMAWERYLNFDDNRIYRIEETKKDGFSVRCLKD
ncbi:MAG: hypothetical protein ISR55_10510 [Bacteroidetes bacterium]|nr:hypothetical protein [FCB group bacterium]MBL6964246.1 hypothetical protein [Bacteroidota bacterium]